MKSLNFEFLRPKWPELAGLGGFAEAYAHPDPVGSISKLRVYCEQVVEWIHHDQRLVKPYRAGLNDLLNNQQGAMAGMRNIYSHGDVDTMQAIDALERLAFISLLFKRVDAAQSNGGNQ